VAPAARRRLTVPGLRGATRAVPAATVARLPLYLRALVALEDGGVSTVSSEELATASGVTSTKLRKDLSYLGSYGRRGVGYEVAGLRTHIEDAMGLTSDLPVVIVGVGHLGRALAGYGGLAGRGFRVVGLLDVNPALVGQQIGSVVVAPVADLERLVHAHPGCIGVLAVPAASAQEVTDRLVAAGVGSILTFAPVSLAVPESVQVRKVDLAVELQILAYHERARSSGPRVTGEVAVG
jgi:redox-sensing transcriptional repressor